jgi:hypothetical protein
MWGGRGTLLDPSTQLLPVWSNDSILRLVMADTPIARAPLGQPYRGPADGRPEGIRFPPARLPLFRKWQLRKRWHYVSFWSRDLVLCAAKVEVGFLANEYWAVWDRVERTFRTKTHYLRRRVGLSSDAVGVQDGDISIQLALQASDAFEVYRPEGRAYIWSHKELCTGAEATVRLGDRTLHASGTAFVDVNAGYHFRHTSWRWAAGAMIGPDRDPVAWNAITGLFDTPEHSERTVWVGSQGTEIGPVRFSDNGNVVTFTEGGELTFREEAVLRKRIGLFLIKSKYDHAFGVYSGTLPGGIEIQDAVGVR